MDPSQFTGLLQAGGVLAFALVVWLELRAMRTEAREDRQEHGKILSELRTEIIRLAERTGPVTRQRRAISVVEDQDDDEPPRRAATPARGVAVIESE
jgi:hypothetical protein